MGNTRTCRKCEVRLTDENSYTSNRRNVCKECHKAESKANKKKAHDDEFRARTCEKCKVYKQGNQFLTRRGYCAQCLGKPTGVESQRCYGCKKWIDTSDFCSTTRYARCSKCRVKKNAQQVGRYRPNRDKVRLNKVRCTKCTARKGYPHFPYYPATQKHSTVCDACRCRRMSWVCVGCDEEKFREEFTVHAWAHRLKDPAYCLVCVPARLYMTEYHDYEYRFARDVVGMTHPDALAWMHKAFGGTFEAYEGRYGGVETPKPYEPYRPDPVVELERKLIEYVDLNSQTVEGTVWCEGPKDKTVWVIRPDGSCAVVNPTKGVEMAYEQPQWVSPIPEEVLQLAKDVLEGYAHAKRDLSGLGHIQPIGQDYVIAATLLRHQREFDKARKPFLEGHAGRASVSTKRLRELAKEDIEVNP